MSKDITNNDEFWNIALMSNDRFFISSQNNNIDSSDNDNDNDDDYNEDRISISNCEYCNNRLNYDDSNYDDAAAVSTIIQSKNASTNNNNNNNNSRVYDLIINNDYYYDNDNNNDTVDNDDNTKQKQQSKKEEKIIRLQLKSLPLDDGICSPLGSEAWYGSALLTSLILLRRHDNDSSDNNNNDENHHFNNSDGELQIWNHLNSNNVIKRMKSSSNSNSNNNKVVVLELGSGAVGLAGIALGLTMSAVLKQHNISNNNNNSNNNCNTTTIVLSDNESNVLQQLQYNVQIATNVIMKEKYSLITMPKYSIQNIDWNHFHINQFYDNIRSINNDDDNYNNTKKHKSSIYYMPLIVGSELVYTKETAIACLNIIIKLLKHHPEALIVLIQVDERDGWNNYFLPTILLQKHNLSVIINKPSIHLHDIASKIIPHGGTLDRMADFTICYIRNNNNNNKDPKV